MRIVDAEAPPERLAALRIVVDGFVVSYLAVRAGVFVGLADRDRSGFDPIGVVGVLDRPAPGWVVVGVFGLAVGSGLAATLGLRHRVTGPLFALALLALVTYRSSWGQLLHFEHLMVLLVAVVALSPAADVWSLDARRKGTERVASALDDVRYGWPVALCGVVVVATYVIASIAKLRYGGVGWLDGETMRNHVAYSAARLDVLGGDPAPLARPAVSLAPWLLSSAAIVTVLIELAAPLALLGGRVRTVWCIAAWGMHAGIVATMMIGFPVPLFGVAFAPFFRIEVGARWIGSRFGRWRALALR